MSIMKALRLHDMSCSPSKKLAISSGASGIRKSKFLEDTNGACLFEITRGSYKEGKHQPHMLGVGLFKINSSSYQKEINPVHLSLIATITS